MESPESQKGQGEKCPICDSIMAVPTGLTPEIKQIIGTIIVIILVCALVLCIYSFYKGYEDVKAAQEKSLKIERGYY